MKQARAVLDFWFGARESAEYGKSRAIWFDKNEAFDAELRARFGFVQRAAATGQLDSWQATPHGALALIVLLDQFPRNMYRGTPAAFACDSHAQHIAGKAVARGFDRGLLPVERWFIYLPFEHAEDIASQRKSLRLFATLRNDPGSVGNMDYARRHHQIVARFGRFPHRNRILGRESTVEEIEFLQQPGSGF
jgi:uncharacterized protein (DUF924 family)